MPVGSWTSELPLLQSLLMYMSDLTSTDEESVGKKLPASCLRERERERETSPLALRMRLEGRKEGNSLIPGSQLG